jgi:hypothetical protein
MRVAYGQLKMPTLKFRRMREAFKILTRLYDETIPQVDYSVGKAIFPDVPSTSMYY